MEMMKSFLDWFSREKRQLKKELMRTKQEVAYWKEQYENAKKYIKEMKDDIHSIND